MEFLLDTHTLLYLLTDPERISAELRSELERALVYVSAASTWEIAIKAGLSKLKIPKNFFECVNELEFEELPITSVHAHEVMKLENIHSDPFDRILVAQARVEHLVIVTNDTVIARYDGIKTRW